MRKTNFLASTVLRSIALAGAGVLLIPAAAQAQDDDGTEATAADQGGNEGVEITVTGSRIRRTTFDTDSPVDTFTREDTVLAGVRAPAEALQNATITSGTAQINNNFLGFVSEGGPGVNTVGLRGLGSQRTLVLLNNRRLAPAGAGPQLVSADLNVLPSAVLSRVEILREGASSIYGSDAVAGVVNIITDTKMNGLTLDAYTDQPLRSGGGRTYRFSAVAGHTFDRGHIIASVEYREISAVTIRDRADFSCPTDYIFDPATGQQIGQRTPTGELRCFPFENGAVGTAENYLLGISFNTGQVNRYKYNNGNINSITNVNNYDVRPVASDRQLDTDVYSPVQTVTGYLAGAWETNIGDTELYGEALFTRRRSQQTFSSQISLDPNQIGFEVYGGSYAGIPLQNFGYPVSPFFPDSLASPAGGGNNILRIFIVPPPLESRQKVNFFRGNAGYRGSLGLGDLRFDANVMYARTAATYSTQNIDTRRIRQSLQPVLAPAGTPAQYVTMALPGQAGAGNGYTCASNVVGGAYVAGSTCVVANFFAPSVLAGDVPDELFNWLYSAETGHTTFDQVTAEFTVDGTLFQLPAGPVGFALGGVYRHDQIVDTPSEAAQTSNLYNYSSAGITAGSDRVWEVYGEIGIPLIRDKPFFYDLSLSGSARFTNYRSYGSDTTYHAGVNWAPADFLRFRGNYGTSFRAPNLFEQNVADQTGFYGAGQDPCNQFGGTLDPASNRYKNCLADLTSAIGAARALAYISTGGPQVITRGGAGNLEAEHSTSWGVGMIVSPPGSGFSFAVDYFNIKVEDEVSLLGANILTRCYDSDEFRAGNVYCGFIGARDTAQGNLTTMLNPYLNIAVQKVSGIDLSTRYSTDIFGGNLVVNGRATRVIHQINQAFVEDDPFDFNGTLGNQATVGGPKWTGSADLRFKTDPFVFRWGVDYVGTMFSDENEPALGIVAPVVSTNGANCAAAVLPPGCITAASDLRTGHYFRHSVSIQIQWKDVAQITFGISNVFDKKPELISSTGNYPRIGNYFNYSGYDFLGRSAFLNVTRSF